MICLNYKEGSWCYTIKKRRREPHWHGPNCFMISIDAHKCFIKQYSLSKIVNKGVEDIEKKFSKIVKDEKLSERSVFERCLLLLTLK